MALVTVNPVLICSTTYGLLSTAGYGLSFSNTPTPQKSYVQKMSQEAVDAAQW